jgi:hypothetical protein
MLIIDFFTVFFKQKRFGSSMKYRKNDKLFLCGNQVGTKKKSHF